MENISSFGQWLRNSRKANAWTQDELASRIGCAATTLRLIEADKRRPSKQLAQRLALVLNVSADDLTTFMQRARGKIVNDGPSVSDARTLDQVSVANNGNSSLLGYDVELAECVALLNEPACRLLTLVGPGGSGKTLLAGAIAERVSVTFRDGVVFVPLAQLSDVALLPAALLIALKVRNQRHVDIEDTLLDYLHTKEMLLIFNHFDQLVTGARLLAQLLELTPTIKLLVTLRERLALQAEWLYDLSAE